MSKDPRGVFGYESYATDRSPQACTSKTVPFALVGGRLKACKIRRHEASADGGSGDMEEYSGVSVLLVSLRLEIRILLL